MKRIAAALSLVAAASMLYAAPADAGVCAKGGFTIEGHGKTGHKCIRHDI